MTVFFCAALFCTGAFCQSGDFAEGERLFRQNDPRGATVYLEKAAASLSYPKAFVYLSVAYYQLGMYAESIDACERGMSVPGTDKKVLAFNAGNSAFAAGDFCRKIPCTDRKNRRNRNYQKSVTRKNKQH